MKEVQSYKKGRYANTEIYISLLKFHGSKCNNCFMKDAVETILTHLKKLGFTEYEGKVYISLLNTHPASAYTISKDSGVPHSRVYDITRRLIEKGVAVSTGVNPEVFTPLSPQELIFKLKREYEQSTDELEKQLKKINFKSDFDPVWNVRNREQAFKLTGDQIVHAQHSVYIGIWSEELPMLSEELKNADNRGVSVFILIYGRDNLDFGETYNHDTEGFSTLNELGRTLDCAVDDRWCITGALGGSRESQIIWTRNSGLVQTIKSYISHDLYLAEISKHFGSSINKKYGRNLAKLRKKFI